MGERASVLVGEGRFRREGEEEEAVGEHSACGCSLGRVVCKVAGAVEGVDAK